VAQLPVELLHVLLSAEVDPLLLFELELELPPPPHAEAKSKIDAAATIKKRQEARLDLLNVIGCHSLGQ
jgi:hypothetical protein